MKQKLMHFLLPIMLGIAVMSSIAYCYSAAYAMPITLALFGFELMTFFVLHKIYNMKHKKLRGIAYVILLAAVLYVTILMLGEAAEEANSRFYAWFFGISQETELGYLSVLCFGGGFLFFSMLYYFTQVRYRGIMTLMLVIFPLAIYAKRLDVIRIEYLAVILFFYLAVMVHNRQTSADSNVTVVADKAYVVSLVTFAAAVILITAVVPKPQIKSMQEKDSNYFNNLDFFELEGTSVVLDSTDFAERLRGSPSGAKLFYVFPRSDDEKIYLKTQSYAYFDDNGWYYGEEKYPKIEYVWTNPEDMLRNMTLSAKLEILESYYSQHVGFEKELESVKKAMALVYDKELAIAMEDGISYDMYIVPQFTYYLDKFNLHDKSAYEVTLNGEYINYARTSSYYVASYQDTTLMRSLAGELSLTDDEWDTILGWYGYMTGQDGEKYSDDYFYGASNEKEFAQSFHNGEYDNYDSEIRELALDITKDCSTDFEKALALEGYFTKAGFTYDMEYYPPDESIEFFIFDSKRGICSDFATAMTLMARSVGLNARYCHGYLAFEKDDEQGGMVVRDSYAHAYTEVYINGIGWMTFEPTVPGFEAMLYDENEVAGNNALVNALNDKGTWIILAVLLLLGILIIVFIRPISEAVYRIYIVRLSTKNPTVATMKLYRRMVKHLAKRLHRDLSAYTVSGTRELLSSCRVDAATITDAFDRSFYGRKELTAEDFAASYEEYKLAYKLKSKDK